MTTLFPIDDEGRWRTFLRLPGIHAHPARLAACFAVPLHRTFAPRCRPSRASPCG